MKERTNPNIYEFVELKNVWFLPSEANCFNNQDRCFYIMEGWWQVEKVAHRGGLGSHPSLPTPCCVDWEHRSSSLSQSPFLKNGHNQFFFAGLSSRLCQEHIIRKHVKLSVFSVHWQQHCGSANIKCQICVCVCIDIYIERLFKLLIYLTCKTWAVMLFLLDKTYWISTSPGLIFSASHLFLLPAQHFNLFIFCISIWSWAAQPTCLSLNNSSETWLSFWASLW